MRLLLAVLAAAAISSTATAAGWYGPVPWEGLDVVLCTEVEDRELVVADPTARLPVSCRETTFGFPDEWVSVDVRIDFNAPYAKDMSLPSSTVMEIRRGGVLYYGYALTETDKEQRKMREDIRMFQALKLK